MRRPDAIQESGMMRFEEVLARHESQAMRCGLAAELLGMSLSTLCRMR